MLNPYQKNALEITLQSLEQKLLRTHAWLRHAPESGRLTRYRPLPEAMRPELEALIERMLDEIGSLAERFDLQPRVEDLGRAINGEMSVAWADLVDTLSTKLGRYGAVDPALGEALDPAVHRLARWSAQLGQMAARATQPADDEYQEPGAGER